MHREFAEHKEEKGLPGYAKKVIGDIESNPQDWKESAYDTIFGKDTPSPSEEKRRTERNFAVVENLGENQDEIRVSSYGRTSTFTIEKNNPEERDSNIKLSFWKDETIQLLLSKERYHFHGDEVKKNMVLLGNLLNFLSYNKRKPENAEKSHGVLEKFAGLKKLAIGDFADEYELRLPHIGSTEIIKLNQGALGRDAFFYLEQNNRVSYTLGEILERIFMEK